MTTNRSLNHGVFVLFVTLAVSLSAVGAATAATPVSTEIAEQHIEATAQEATLSGVVLDSSGQPLSNTQVALTSESGSFGVVVETDGDGQFSRSDVEPGVNTLIASAEGYGDSAPVTVDIGSNATGVVFELTAATEARLEGQITDSEGKPLDAGTMVAFQSNEFESSRSVQLETNGTYALTAVPTGEYTVTVTTESRSSVETVTVTGTGPTTQQFSLVPSGETVLTGHVLNQDGTPLPAETWVRFEADNGFGPARTVSLGADGQYALTDLPSDGNSYNLRVEAEGVGSTTTIVSLPSGADTERDFTLSPVEPLTITDIEAPEQAAAGSEVTASVTVSNSGPSTVTESVEYRFNGQIVSTQSLTVSPGATRSFSVGLTPTEAGSVTHGVFTEHDAAYTAIEIASAGSVGDGDDGDTGGDTGNEGGGDSSGGTGGSGVGVGAPLPPVGEPVDAPTDGDTDDTSSESDEESDLVPGRPTTNSTDSTSNDSDDEQSTQDETTDSATGDTDEQDSTSESSDGQPGFGVLATLCAFIAGLGVARRRL